MRKKELHFLFTLLFSLFSYLKIKAQVHKHELGYGQREQRVKEKKGVAFALCTPSLLVLLAKK